jgi:hypothetical protein
MTRLQLDLSICSHIKKKKKRERGSGYKVSKFIRNFTVHTTGRTEQTV